MDENEIYLKLPKHKKSKKTVDLFNVNGEVVGSFKRTLKNNKQVLVDILSLYELAVINFDVFNKSNGLIGSINTDFTLVKKMKWHIKGPENKGEGTVIQSSLLKSKSFKVFDITLDSRVFQLKSDDENYIVKSNHEIIATIEDIDKSRFFAENYKIKFNCDQDLALLLITIFYIFLITS